MPSTLCLWHYAPQEDLICVRPVLASWGCPDGVRRRLDDAVSNRLAKGRARLTLILLAAPSRFRAAVLVFSTAKKQR